MTTPTVDSIKEGFPYPDLEKVHGTPTFTDIREIHTKLKANAASIASERGGRNHGLLSLVMAPATYTRITGYNFHPPDNPGNTPRIPRNTPPEVVQDMRAQHKEEIREWREYRATANALRQQIIATFEETHLRILRNAHTGYNNATPLDMLNHLYRTYGQITPKDLEDNDQRMRTPYDPAQPITNLFAQLQEAVDFADAAQRPYSNEQLLSRAYNLVFQTGLYKDTCKDWRRLQDANKTWDQFKQIFHEAYRDLQSLETTAQNAKYHQANNAEAYNQESEETMNALAMLAQATEADRTTVANLTQTNTSLLKQLEQANSTVETLSKTITELQKQMAALTSHNTTKMRTDTKEQYCWSHGRTRTDKHTSANCLRKKEGHQDNATLHNRMGGSSRWCADRA